MREKKRKRDSTLARAKSRHRSPAVRPTHFRASVSPSPAATRSHSAIRPEGAACHPRARLPSPSRVRPRRRKARVRQPVHPTRRVARAMGRRPLPHHHPLALPFRLFLPPRPCQAHRMCAACPCPHVTQPLVQAAASAQLPLQILPPLRRRAVFRLRGHDKPSRNTGCVMRALVPSSYQSLTASPTVRPAPDSRRPMARSRRASAKTLLASFLHHPLSRVPGHPYLVPATAAQPPSCGSVVPFDHALVRGIPARAQAQAQAARAHVTTRTCRYLARRLRSDVRVPTVLSRALAMHRVPASSSFLGV